jgi:hypothetical protein
MAEPVGVRIRVDDSEVRRAMQGLERSIPFAISLGVNLIAKKAVAELKSHLRDDGIIQRTKWVENHISIWKVAKKTDPTAVVGSPDAIMATAAQEGGGPRLWAGLVPVVGPHGARETKESVIRGDLKRNSPNAERLLAQRARSPRGATRFFRRGNTIYEKTGPATLRQRGTGSRMVLSGPVFPVFRVPKNGVHIPHRWQLQRRIAIVQERWGAEIMAEAIQRAIDTHDFSKG